jgi:hypothetical protein
MTRAAIHAVAVVAASALLAAITLVTLGVPVLGGL